MVALEAFCALGLTTFVENACIATIIGCNSKNVIVFINLSLAPCLLFEEKFL
jgi:hypothetical protein